MGCVRLDRWFFLISDASKFLWGISPWSNFHARHQLEVIFEKKKRPAIAKKLPFWYKLNRLQEFLAEQGSNVPSLIHGGINMRQDAKKSAERSWTNVVRGFGKVILIGGMVAATAGAGGSFSFNICPTCGSNLRTQDLPGQVEEIDKQPRTEADTNVLKSDVSPLPKSVQRAP